jgi:hypothetical protein
MRVADRDGKSVLAAALNRVAGIAAVAAGCPAANCDAARAACGALNSDCASP